ncbi:PREDICTED: mast/stem cell growth factor receptor Kit-like isoform X2 [Branchiostoma belcheri]|uniref:Mast/stem cell growth factor receptor Kit-like isoform X2 n=1 Tax=Branchiostoma belcheri TaxID=7741 RepID=A0A6P5A1V0_BRABE|nr:PREDICTED: mast/stem cell growth factor receptor Kit-like isoform X2 [Branchiostoma belcheri]
MSQQSNETTTLGTSTPLSSAQQTSTKMTTNQRPTPVMTSITSTEASPSLKATPAPSGTDWVAIGVAIGLNLLAIAIIASLYCWWRARKRRRQELDRSPVGLELGHDNPIIPRPSGRQVRSPSQDYVNDLVPGGPRPSIAGIADGWEIPETNIHLQTELGSGQFGKVYKGEAYGIDRQQEWRTVAIKTLRTEDQKAQDDFVKEQRVMSKLQHGQLVRMLGCCTTSDPLLLIMEYMENGDLAKFLRKNHDDFHSDGPCPGNHGGQLCLTPKRLATFANDTARGMGYLESKKSRPLPVFWMSLESLYEGEFTTKSDVWAFGIVLWELATLGGRPYPGMDAMQVQRELKRGYRMPKPRNCTEEMYVLMRWCWERNPDRRPTFRQLVAETNKLKQDRPRPSVSGSTTQQDSGRKQSSASASSVSSGRRESADVSSGRRQSSDVSSGRRQSSDVSSGRRQSSDVSSGRRQSSDVSSRRESNIGRFDVLLE